MPKRKQYEWSGKAARYRDPITGRFITRNQVRGWVDKLVDASQRRLAIAADDLRQGKTTVAQWQSIMRDEIKQTQLATEALVRGGWEQMTARDFGRVGARVREQFKYLDGFTRDLLNDRQTTDGRFIQRAKSYAAAARVNFHESQTDQLSELGYSEERNVLHPAEHCLDCLDQAALGWVPIGTLTPIGSRQCRVNDRCSVEYR
jgi:hypothetical protein